MLPVIFRYAALGIVLWRAVEMRNRPTKWRETNFGILPLAGGFR